MQTLTVEMTAKVLDKFGIAFTDGAVKSMVQRQQLKAVPKPYTNVRNSKYNFAIEMKSLVDMLRNKGIADKDIKDAIPDGIKL